MNATSNYYTEKVRKRMINTVWYHSHTESKIRHKWTYLQSRNRLRHRAWTRGCRGEKGRLGLQSQKMQAITHRMNNNRVLLYSTCNPSQHPLHNEKEQKKTTCTPICIRESLCRTLEITHCKSTMLQFKPRLCDNLEGWSGDGREAQEEGTRVYLWLIHADGWQKPTQSSNDPQLTTNKK